MLTWLIIKILGIFLLNFLWLRNTTMTVKFATIPTEATVLWMIRIDSSLALSLLELFDVKDTVANVLLYWNSFAPLSMSILKTKLKLIITEDTSHCINVYITQNALYEEVKMTHSHSFDRLLFKFPQRIQKASKKEKVSAEWRGWNIG